MQFAAQVTPAIVVPPPEVPPVVPIETQTPAEKRPRLGFVSPKSLNNMAAARTLDTDMTQVSGTCWVVATPDLDVEVADLADHR
eukprot:2704282-Heterocapsa_arctica.AAC.1